MGAYRKSAQFIGKVCLIDLFLYEKWRGIRKCMLSSSKTTLIMSKTALNQFFFGKKEIWPWSGSFWRWQHKFLKSSSSFTGKKTYATYFTDKSSGIRIADIWHPTNFLVESTGLLRRVHRAPSWRFWQLLLRSLVTNRLFWLCLKFIISVLTLKNLRSTCITICFQFLRSFFTISR